MISHYSEQEYFPALEGAVLTLSFADGLVQDFEYQAHTEPDFAAAIATVAERFHLEEEDIDVGTERREVDGRYVFHIYHPPQGLLARVSYTRTRY